MSINKPKSLSRNGKLHKNWNEFKNSFRSYLESSKIQESNNEPAGVLFLDTIGLYGFEIASELKLLNLSKDNIKSDISLKDVYQHFDNHCQFNSNLTLSRYQFFNAKQGKENFDAFLSSLDEMSKNCEFGDLRDSLLMVQIISGISNKELQDDLYLIINDLDLAKTIQKCNGKKPKKLQQISDAKKHDLIDANDKLDKDNNATIPVASTSRKRNVIDERSEANLEKTVPDDSPSTSKIPRKTTLDKKDDDAVSETESTLAEDKDKHNIAKKRHISTETIVENESRENSAAKPKKVIQDESESEEGEIPAVPFKTSFICKFCGKNHRYGSCPHFGDICQLCGTRGHIATVCRWYNK